jgi:protein TonB
LARQEEQAMSRLSPATGQLDPLDPLDRGSALDFLPDPIGRPMIWAVLFHILLIAGAAGFALLSGLLPQHLWGGANDGGAIAVQLVSSAVPLPQDRPPNDNVLATEKPSEAPAAPAAKVKATEDQTAIAIPNKVTAPKKQADKHQQASNPVKPQPAQQISRNATVPQPNQRLDNHAQYGEQAASNQQRSMQTATTSTNGQVAVSSGARGFNYPWYIEALRRKMDQSGYRGTVDPRTPVGSRSYILFTIRRDGGPTNIRLDRSSGSPTLDQACLRAAQRVDTFGPLPSPPNDGNAEVSYYCEY